MTTDQLIAAAAVEAQLCQAAADLYRGMRAVHSDGSFGKDLQAVWGSWIEHRDEARAYLRWAREMHPFPANTPARADDPYPAPKSGRPIAPDMQ